VEGSFSWLGQNRWMSKDYERLTATSEVFVYVAMIRLMLKRLARA
jgi:putative transposase